MSGETPLVGLIELVPRGEDPFDPLDFVATSLCGSACLPQK